MHLYRKTSSTDRRRIPLRAPTLDKKRYSLVGVYCMKNTVIGLFLVYCGPSSSTPKFSSFLSELSLIACRYCNADNHHVF